MCIFGTMAFFPNRCINGVNIRITKIWVGNYGFDNGVDIGHKLFINRFTTTNKYIRMQCFN